MFAQVLAGRGHGVDARQVVVEIRAAARAHVRRAGVVDIVPFGIERCGGFAGQHVGRRGGGGIGRFGRGGQRVGRAAGIGAGVGAFVAFQQRVALQLLLDEGGDLDVGGLQQLDRLAQLRRHHQRCEWRRSRRGPIATMGVAARRGLRARGCGHAPRRGASRMHAGWRGGVMHGGQAKG